MLLLAEPFAEGAAHRLGAVGDLELGEDAGGQVADSLGDKLQPLGDGGVVDGPWRSAPGLLGGSGLGLAGGRPVPATSSRLAWPTVSPGSACQARAVGLANQVALALLGQGSSDHGAAAAWWP
jgi:hypothetical protein